MTKKDLPISVYKSPDGTIKLDISLDKETIWLSQKQMSFLFDKDSDTISDHLQEIYKSWELIESSTTGKFPVVQLEWKREVKRNIRFYNLDAIISVWYRVNSKKATHFRQRATQVLKQHIVQWYTINRSRIQENYAQFLHAVKELEHLSQDTTNIWSSETIELIKTFASTRFSIESYDRNELPNVWYTQQSISIQAKELYKDIEKLKENLIDQSLATELFAQEKNPDSLGWIVGNVFQSVFEEDAYPTLEEKAAHLLYFIIKNHPFNDGNKRTWAFSFVWFLGKAWIPFRKSITPEALTSLTIMIAESNPKDKQRMIWLVILLLSKAQ